MKNRNQNRKRKRRKLFYLFLPSHEYIRQYIQEFAHFEKDIDESDRDDQPGNPCYQEYDPLHNITSFSVVGSIKKDSERIKSNKGT